MHLADYKPKMKQHHHLTYKDTHQSNLDHMRGVRALGLWTLDLTTAELLTKANKDEEYKELLKSIKTIKDPRDIPSSGPIKEYSPVWENLSIQETECGDVILLNNKALIIPKSERKPLLHQLHEFHGGAEKSYNLARTFWFWPTMKHEIHQMAQQCDIC